MRMYIHSKIELRRFFGNVAPAVSLMREIETQRAVATLPLVDEDDRATAALGSKR